MSKIPFRVSDGLDGADVRAINIGYPKKDSPKDGVNVQFFIDENTIQQYDSTRKYKANFAVMMNDRIYYAKRDVPTDGSASAGAFNETHWQQLRTDPNWMNVITTAVEGLQLLVGSYVSADSSYSDLDFILPRSPKSGDTVVIKDVSGVVGVKALRIKTIDKIFDNGKQDYQVTYPKSTVIFTYDPAVDLNRGGWRITTVNPKVSSKFVAPTAQGTQMYNGDTLFRRSASGKIKMILPRYANEGDFIVTHDVDQMTSVNNLTIDVHPDSTSSIGKVGVKTETYKTVGWGILVYSAATDLWVPWDGDEYERWNILYPVANQPLNINLIPSSRIMVAGNEGEINFTLPLEPAVGDIITISLRNAAKGVKVNFKTSTGVERIYASANMFGIPRLNEVSKFDDIIPVAEIKHVATGYGEQFKLVYISDATRTGWILAEQSFSQFRASKDATVRDQPGLVSFATEAEVLLNSEQTPSDETAVTPLALSKKTATEIRRGIAKVATKNETNDGIDDSKIVTPKKLHERTALEDRRGIAEIADQNETNAGVDDSRIVTPKKLAGRVSKEDQTGVIALVKVGATPQADRTTPGTNVNDFNQHDRAVTPKTLAEKVASETNLGMGYWATQTEVNNGTEGNVFVRPATLHQRTATPTRTGLARMVDMALSEHLKNVTESKDENVFITPKALASRIAGSEMDGITRPAYAQDIAAGTHEIKYVSPAKLKYFADEFVKVTTPDPDGLNVTGTLWKGLVFKVDASTESKRGTIRLATQDETNTGTVDDAIVTPKKLNARTATETRTGIIRLATANEAAAGTRDDVAITPLTMGSALNNSSEWGSTEVRRGSAYIASLTNDNTATTVWQGSDEAGSTRAIVNYKHDFYAVSPRGLNTALAHYLPIKAKAVDSGKLDGLLSSSYMRTDKDTTTSGSITASKQVNAASFKFDKAITVSGEAGYLGWNKDATNKRADLINVSAAGTGGFAFWQGADEVSLKQIASLDRVGKLSLASVATTGDVSVGRTMTVAGELNYKNQKLDDRFVRITGSRMTGILSFDANYRIAFIDNETTDNNVMIEGSFKNGGAYLTTVNDADGKGGKLDIYTNAPFGSTTYMPITFGQRTNHSFIQNTVELLTKTGDTVIPKSLTAESVISRTTIDPIKWGDKGAKVNNAGDVFGEVWENKYLSEYIKGIVDKKVNKAGDTITENLILEKDIIIQGSLKIKVGNKFLVIRPNEANETVSFDWE